LKKWAKVKAVHVATKKKVVGFIRENIFYKFGFPRELVTDQGDQFTSNLIEGIMEKNHMKYRKSNAYHSQENWQVNIINRSLEKFSTKCFHANRRD